MNLSRFSKNGQGKSIKCACGYSGRIAGTFVSLAGAEFFPPHLFGGKKCSGAFGAFSIAHLAASSRHDSYAGVVDASGFELFIVKGRGFILHLFMKQTPKN
jgi:hypothetical protein